MTRIGRKAASSKAQSADAGQQAPIAGEGMFRKIVRIVTGEVGAREQLVEQSRRFERLAMLSKEIASGSDLEQVLRQVVANAVELTGAGGGVIALNDGKNHRVTYPYSHGVPVDLSQLSFPGGTGLVGHVIETREPVILDDHADDTEGLEVFGRERPHSAIVAPLLTADEIAGALGLFAWDGDKKFDADDLNIAAAIAEQAAVAIENSRLLEETSERLRIHRELTRTAVSISSGLELDKILTEVVRSAAEVLKADAAMFALVDEERGIITFPHAWSLPDDLKTLDTRSGRGLADAVIRSGKPHIVNDYPSHPDRRPEFVAAGVAAVASVPLMIAERCIGAIGVMDLGSGQKFISDDIDVLSIISQQAAVAVENARLYDKLSRFTQTLEARVEERTEALSHMYEDSEKKSAELREANIRLRELDRLKSEFLANMSHELRTPLNSIIGFSKLIIDGLDGDINEEQKQDLEIVYNNSMELLHLIDDLLDLAKIEAGRASIVMREEDPAELVLDVMMSLRSAAEAKGLTISSDCPEDVHPIIMDRGKTRQILMNLAGNAVKFTEKGSVGVHLTQGPEETVFKVTDSGPGLTAGQAEMVFDRFHQVDGDKAETQGVGLGLTLSKRFAEMQGGSLRVDSEYGRGSTFSFSIPNETGINRDIASPVEMGK